jgi:hypothetical protein
VAVVEQLPKGGDGVMVCRDCSHTRIYLALLCICDAHILYTSDQCAVMARKWILFMVIVASCMYDMHSVDAQLVQYA